jgi:hypothetical protein
MFNKVSAQIRKTVPLFCLTFSLHLILSSPALSYQPTIDFNSKAPKPPALVQSGIHQVEAFILLMDSNNAQLAQVQNFIKMNGGRTIHIFPYQAIIAKASPDVVSKLANLSSVAAVFTEAVELAALASYGPTARRFASAWNNMVAAPSVPMDLGTMSEGHTDNHDDVFIAPDMPSAKKLSIAANNPVTPGYYQTSEYMAGSVAVGIVLVESNGSIDPSTENWTPDEKQLVFNEIMAAFNWWARLEPRANLSFVYDDHFSNPLPTSVEPITRPFTDQRIWINDAMSALGYNANYYFTQVRDYDNTLRATYQTNWAFTIFVTDSSNDNDHRFSDGYFGYAYLGGPFLVLTYGNNGYGPSNMDAVAAHEIGHIFAALDQYSSASQPCNRRSGYLNVENQNSQYGSCASNVNSIMRGQTFPFSARAIDPYAAGQIGWRDSDDDSIFDPLDTQLSLTPPDLLLNNNRVIANGLAQIIPYPAPSRASVTINTLTSVQYRLNQGEWQPATASDGAFDGTVENYNFTSQPLLPDLHLLEIAAFDSAGNISDTFAPQTIIIPDPTDPGPNTQLYAPDNLVAEQSVNLDGVAYHAQGGNLVKVEVRVNSSTWQLGEAQDGIFDSNYEPFTLSINLSEPGTYLIEARATDVNGNVEVNFSRREILVGQIQSSTIFLPLVREGL